MLNIEKYEKEIIDIGLNDFGYTKDTGVKRCDDIYCCDCIFCDNRGCSSRKIIEWLASEYKPSILNEEEKKILNEEEKKILNDLIEVNKKLTSSKFLYVTKLPTNSNSSKCYLYLTFECWNICDTLAFYSDTIFSRMEINKQYSLEDLGLC